MVPEQIPKDKNATKYAPRDKKTIWVLLWFSIFTKSFPNIMSKIILSMALLPDKCFVQQYFYSTDFMSTLVPQVATTAESPPVTARLQHCKH
jgi:hypothetical protein